MANIYNLTNEYNELYAKLFESIDLETGEIDEELQKAIEIKKEELIVKTEALACFIKKTEATEEEIDKEIERLKALKKRCATVRTRVEKSITDSLIALGESKVESIHANVSFRESTRTIIENEEALPDEFKKVKISFEPKKTEIKKAIEQGLEVPGARLEKVKNIQIK